ncbi:MAG: fructose 1,6-bisphosphatase [Thaumarchaeota archaeon]|nr:fructose 1,6-bisphosphatase [Nitrososphaerota archaeon]
MTDWATILDEMASSAQKEIGKLKGTAEAGFTLGRGAGGDITRRIDRVAEDAVIQVLRKRDIGCRVVSEEYGELTIGDDREGFRVIIDSIDGTTNAIRDIPFYCTSLAVSNGGNLRDVFAGLVIDQYSGDRYVASKGHGAYHSGKRMEPSHVGDMTEALIGIDLSGVSLRVARELSQFISKTRHTRHLGAAALEVCMVAEGRLDAYVDMRNKLRVTDIAAAQLILTEAGGVIVALDGSSLDSTLSLKERLSFVAAGKEDLCSKILGSVLKRG